MSVLQPTPLQEPVADLGFLNGGGSKCRRHEDRGVAGTEGYGEYGEGEGHSPSHHGEGRGCAPPSVILVMTF